jgi:hypothetical protein
VGVEDPQCSIKASPSSQKTDSSRKEIIPCNDFKKGGEIISVRGNRELSFALAVFLGNRVQLRPF